MGNYLTRNQLERLMLEGNAVEAKSQKVSEKAVLAAVDVPGTLVEKTPFSAPSATPAWSSARGTARMRRTAKISTSGAGTI